MFFRENCTHGFEIRDYVTGNLFFKNRPMVKKYSLARMRVFDLARRTNGVKIYAIWDGSNAISRLHFKDGHVVKERDYLNQPETFEILLTNGEEFKEKEYLQKIHLEKDYRDEQRSRLKNQKMGMSGGDITSWTKAEHKESSVPVKHYRRYA